MIGKSILFRDARKRRMILTSQVESFVWTKKERKSFFKRDACKKPAYFFVSSSSNDRLSLIIFQSRKFNSIISNCSWNFFLDEEFNPIFFFFSNVLLFQSILIRVAIFHVVFSTIVFFFFFFWNTINKFLYKLREIRISFKYFSFFLSTSTNANMKLKFPFNVRFTVVKIFILLYANSIKLSKPTIILFYRISF